LGVLKGMMIGLVSGPALVVIGGALIGGSQRLAPCHESPNFAYGAVFGALIYTELFGVPAAVVGAIGGVVVGLWNQRKDLISADRQEFDVDDRSFDERRPAYRTSSNIDLSPDEKRPPNRARWDVDRGISGGSGR
jgi:hypothetical protein